MFAQQGRPARTPRAVRGRHRLPAVAAGTVESYGGVLGAAADDTSPVLIRSDGA
ncbi:hypothetical protein ABZ468_04510 [Streptomyces sp. NPDC005708]|uniref:hypothetical protein n=1 Tax=unclassified Streptomyces TaxID=2593676 RepID=UPI0033EDB432